MIHQRYFFSNIVRLSLRTKIIFLIVVTLLVSAIILIVTAPSQILQEHSLFALVVLLLQFFIITLWIIRAQETVEVEKLNNQLLKTLDATGDALWDWDLRTNIITHNSQWCKLTGLGEDFLSHPLADFIHLLYEEDRPIVWERLQTCLADKGPYLSEHRLYLPGGHSIWVLDRGNVVERDEQGQALRMIGTFLDVTQSHEEALAQRELSFQRAEERLQLVLRASNDGWWDWNLEIKKYCYSDRWWSMLGYDNKGFTIDSNLKNFFQLIHIDDRERVRKFYNEIDGYSKSFDFTSKISDDQSVQKSDDITYELEFSLRHKDGHYLPIFSRGFIVYDASGKAVRLSGVNTDLTEQKKAKQALVDSESLFREISDVSPLAIFMYEDDDAAQTSLYINKTFVKLFGYTLEDTPTVHDFWPRAYPDPEYRNEISQEWQKRVSAAAATKTSIDPMDMYVTCKDGSVKYISWGYTAQGNKNWGFGLDLTAFKQAEKDLQASKEKLRAILEASPDGIVVSSLDGIIEFVSPQTQLMWGYSEDEFLGKHIFEVMTESAKAVVQNTITELLKGNNLGAIEYEMVRKDGSHFICEANCNILCDSNQQPISVLYIQRDVTERTLAAKELVLAQQNTERASLAKSQLVSYMSHEFRTPLSVIIGYAQLISSEEQLNKDQSEYINEILKGGNHLLRLINQMLDMAAIESGHINFEMADESISEIIEHCLVQSAPLAKLKEMVCTYQHTVNINTYCDRTRLVQVLMNLITNAIKYTDNGGCIDITAQPNGRHEFMINVKDNGIGIALEKQFDIFNPFSRVNHSDMIEGAGLGLTITRQLIDLMGGKVSFTSDVGVGTNFCITLPLVSDHLEKSQALLNMDQLLDSPLPSSCVLYVDDNASNLKLVKKMFKDSPQVQLITLQTPNKTIIQALELNPDVIILDINMPEMDGYQVLATLQADARLRTIPVIALTANAFKEDVALGLAAGFSFYLTKPVDKKALMNAINRCLTAHK